MVSEQRPPNRNRRNSNRRYQRETPRSSNENSFRPRISNKNVRNFNDDRLAENLMNLKLHPREDEKRKEKPKKNGATPLVRDGELIPTNVKAKQEFVMTTNEETLKKNNDTKRKTVSDDKESIVDDAIPSLDDDDLIYVIGSNPDAGAYIPNAVLSDIKSRRTYDISISEVNRPWRFWFHLTDKYDIDLMEENLRWYYQDNSSYDMNKLEMIIGHACVVFQNNKWLRAEFIERPVNDRVKVCLVDYGTIDIVDVSHCRFLAKCFCSIPKHCYNGVLEYIEPIDNREKELALVRNFCEMIENKPLFGFVTKVDYKNNEVRMIIIDTSSEYKDVLINKELLSVLHRSE